VALGVQHVHLIEARLVNSLAAFGLAFMFNLDRFQRGFRGGLNPPSMWRLRARQLSEPRLPMPSYGRHEFAATELDERSPRAKDDTHRVPGSSPARQPNSSVKSGASEKWIKVPFGFWHRFGAARHIEK
jgi:hypothetical protein